MATRVFIDFGSDTKTRPTPAMREAMANADCGDEAAFEDPTVNALCERVAGLLGKQAAVFMPSGTMCNQVALTVLGKPGDDVVCDESAHIVWYEVGGTAANAGLNALTIKGDRGRFSADQLRAAQRLPRMRHSPRQTVLSIEQTCNLAGGAVWPAEQIESVCAAARELGMKTHMDGARLLNAVIATGVPAARFAAPFDSAWIDFSKGLGAPVGAALAGDRAFIDECWYVKQRFGGAMRQAGIIAAAALYALDHHVDRMADDHANARAMAQGLAGIDGIVIDPREVETNLVYFELAPQVPQDGAAFCKAQLARGVRMVALGPRRVRAVTHLDIDAADVATAINAVGALLRG
jgi:threonine aldolase